MTGTNTFLHFLIKSCPDSYAARKPGRYFHIEYPQFVNCSSSVEPFKAPVEEVPPVIT